MPSRTSAPPKGLNHEDPATPGKHRAGHRRSQLLSNGLCSGSGKIINRAELSQRAVRYLHRRDVSYVERNCVIRNPFAFSNSARYLTCLAIIIVIHGFLVRGVRIESQAFDVGSHGANFWAYPLFLCIAFITGVWSSKKLADTTPPQKQSDVLNILMLSFGSIVVLLVWGTYSWTSYSGGIYLRYLGGWAMFALGAFLFASSERLFKIVSIIIGTTEATWLGITVVIEGMLLHWVLLAFYFPTALCENTLGNDCLSPPAGGLSFYMLPFRHFSHFSFESGAILVAVALIIIAASSFPRINSHIIGFAALSVVLTVILLLNAERFSSPFLETGALTILFLHLVAIFAHLCLPRQLLWSRIVSRISCIIPRLFFKTPSSIRSSSGCVCIVGSIFYLAVALIPDPLRMQYGDRSSATFAYGPGHFTGWIVDGWHLDDFLQFSAFLALVGLVTSYLTPLLFVHCSKAFTGFNGVLAGGALFFSMGYMATVSGPAKFLAVAISAVLIGSFLGCIESLLMAWDYFVRTWGSGSAFAFIFAVVSALVVLGQLAFPQVLLFGTSNPAQSSFMLPSGLWQFGSFDTVDSGGVGTTFAIPYILWASFPICLVVPLMVAKLLALYPHLCRSVVIVSFCWTFALGWTSFFCNYPEELVAFWLWRVDRQIPFFILLTALPMLWSHTSTGQPTRPALKPVTRSSFSLSSTAGNKTFVMRRMR